MKKFHMLLSLLFCCGEARKPVFLVPGFGSSLLNATYEIEPPMWYCKKKGVDETLFTKFPGTVPPFTSCMMDMMKLEYDDATDTIHSRKGVNIGVRDFGGLSGISHYVTGPFGINMYGYFAQFIKEIENRGWTERETLFGIPWDWRLGLHQSEAFWNDMKKLIEDGVAKNNQEKAVLVGHSHGCNMIVHFLNHKVSKEWKEQFIGKLVFVAPAFGGSFIVPLQYFGTRDVAPFVSKEKMAAAVRSWPCMYDLLPNEIMMGNETIFVTADGKPVKVSEAPEFLANNALSEEEVKIMKKSIGMSRRLPEDTGIETFIMHNSKIGCAAGYDLTTGKDIVVPGDDFVIAKGADYVCDNWSKIQCVDVKEGGGHLDHLGLLTNTMTLTPVMSFIEKQPKKDWSNLEL